MYNVIVKVAHLTSTIFCGTSALLVTPNIHIIIVEIDLNYIYCYHFFLFLFKFTNLSLPFCAHAATFTKADSIRGCWPGIQKNYRKSTEKG